MQETLANKDTSTSTPGQNATWWYRAASLTERISMKDALVGTHNASFRKVSEKAEQILQRWKAQTPFDKDDYFDQRLAIDGLTENELLALLDESVETLVVNTTPPPCWFTELLAAFTEHDTSSYTLSPGGTHLEHNQSTQDSAFLYPIRPLLRKKLAHLQVGVVQLSNSYSSLPFDPKTIIALLFAHLPSLLYPKLIKTIVLELHVARVQGHLQGNTPEERFQNFLEQLCQPERMLSLFEEYAVLARNVEETLDRWMDCQLELLERLCADWEQIVTTFVPDGDPGVLVEIQQEVGDTHRGGHNVTLLTWSSGFRLVYKPRPMTLDIHFQELLTWLNERGQQPPFRTIAIVDKQSYGWSEFVYAANCTSRAEVERFYQRQGGNLALLYALAASDFHAENIIASGEHPVLIDLEALFQPRLSEESQQSNPAQEIMSRSVLRIGLLPQRIWADEQTEGVDISGLGGYAGQLTPTPVPVWKEKGTDQMRLARERISLSLSKNQPKLNGQDISLLEYSDSFANGFAATYALLIQYRSELLQEIVPRFSHDEIRYILRPTRAYGLLLMESFHPNLLRDALERDRFFDRLWIGVEDRPYLVKVIASERADLLAGDIPLFTTHANSHAIVTCSHDSLPDFFAESGLDVVCKRIRHLDEQDLERQLWLIRASFTSVILGTQQTTAPQLRGYISSQSHSEVSSERLLLAAHAVGDRLCQLAHRADEAVGWIGVDSVMDRQWGLFPASFDLYSGTSGIALFLAYLGAVTDEERYTQLAKVALASTRTQVEWQKQYLSSAGIGTFSGLGSYIYLLSHVGTLWNDPTLFQEAEEIVKCLADGIAQDEMLDVIGGSAGCISALLSLYSVAPSQHTLEMMIRCGERLVASASPQQRGIGWPTTLQETPLTGLAHGNAGMALNLLRLSSVSGVERFRETAFAAMDYERGLYSLEHRNWPDLRKQVRQAQIDSEQQEEHSYMVAWCHGAPGIGLARLSSLTCTDEPTMYEEIEAAFQTTLAHGFGLNHCLCHGDMGNIEFVMSAIKKLQSLAEYEEQVQHVLSRLLDSIEQQGLVTGVPLGVETPGLMTGIAGTGYALLRAAYPERIPSVLVLAPPIPNLK